MSSARFVQLVSSAYNNNDLTSMRDAYSQWQDVNCLHPQTIQIVDSHTQLLRTIQVPCGSCYHCTQSKINEWCTRMYAHAEDFKNVYFVTLTYRSITDPNNEVNKLLLNKLSQAVWHRDCYNSTHHLCYRPCILVKKHYQDFLKRLRKNTGINDLTYVVAGEYGHEYGAPHFHLILFTNHVLTVDDIQRAWSIQIWKSFNNQFTYFKNQKYNGTRYNFPIGRIDFHDLVSNGTMNTAVKVKVDGTFMNAGNCFAYVAKYVVKRDNANLKRVRMSYNAIFHPRAYVKVFDNEIPFDIVKDYLLKNGFPFEEINNTISNLKSLKYVKTIYDPDSNVIEYGLCRSKRVEKNGFVYSVELLPSLYFEYRDSFRPFCEFSRGCPIGSLYAKNHIHEFTQGVFNKPLLQVDGFVVPSYFRRKAENYLYGLRKLHKTIKSTSLVFSGLVDLYRCIDQSIKDDDPFFPHSYASSHYDSPKKALSSDLCTFADLYTKERIVLWNGTAYHFLYDRSSRDYQVTREIPLLKWLRFWRGRLIEEFKRNDDKTREAIKSHSLSERALLMLLDCGEEHNQLVERYERSKSEQRESADKMYHDVHLSAE